MFTQISQLKVSGEISQVRSKFVATLVELSAVIIVHVSG